MAADFFKKWTKKFKTFFFAAYADIKLLSDLIAKRGVRRGVP